MSRTCLMFVLGMALLNPAAQAAIVVIGGVVVDDDNRVGQPNMQVTLCCMGRKGCISPVETSKSGVFLLSINVTPLPDELFVVCENDEWLGEPVRVSVPKDSHHGIYSTIAKDLVVGRCSPAKNATAPSKLPKCVTALGTTARVKMAAGMGSSAKADERFQASLRRLLDGVQGWDRERVQMALASLEGPFQGKELPTLAGARSFAFPPEPREMLATNRGFCEPSVKVGRADIEPYQERSDRCEGAIVSDTSGAVELVSLTQGPFAFDPQMASVDLQWSDVRGTDVCLSAKPTRPGLGWLMNTERPGNAKSFRWELGPARKAGLERGSLGVAARECDGRKVGAYVPLKAAGGDPSKPYEVVLLASSKVKDAFVTVEDRQPDRPKRLVIPRSRAVVANDLRPLITIRIPRENNGPGEYVVALQIYGVTAQGDGSVSFSFRHD